jgi:hypothetical protein
MPIISTDILYRLSGGSGNSSQAASLGGAKSTAGVASSAILDDVNSAESAAGDVNYRCLYVHNNHGSLTMQNTVLWVQANTPSSDTTIEIGIGTSAINATEQTVANEATAPAGVTFTSPSSIGAGITLGNIPPGQHQAFWIRRTVNAAAAAANDTFTLRVGCDTAA